MQLLFNPAITLLNRISYNKKFTLLWLLSLVSIAVVVYGLAVNLDRVIKPSRQQLEGLALIKPVVMATQSLQLHRGLSTALLGGNETLNDRRADQEKKVDEAFRVMMKSLPAELVAGKEFQHIIDGWAQLRQGWSGRTEAENFVGHTRLIGEIQSFKTFISDKYSLALDQDISSHYMVDTAINKLPQVLERLGQLRAYGAGILARKEITEDQKFRLKVMIIELDTALGQLDTSFSKTSHHNPALKETLRVMNSDIADLVRRIADLISADILSGRFTTSSEDFLFMATTAIDRSYVLMYDRMLPMVEEVIKARTDRTKQEMLISAGISFFIFVLVVYFSVSIYYAIIDNIRMLERSARAFAGGDLSTRIKLDTRDEFRQIGDSFNEMADGFSALLEAQSESGVRLRSIIETALDAVVQMDDEGIITGWNRQAESIFGWSAAEAVGRSLKDTIIPPQYRDAHALGLRNFLANGKGNMLGSRVELLGLHRDGHEFPVELSITAIRAGAKYEFNGFIRDITKKKESEEMIWEQANFDALTGLPNRHMFHDRLEQEIKKADRADAKVALLFIDLDKFKEVNDTMGHSKGDILLMEAAQRISSCVRETDTVARLGGDEYTVILSELDDARKIERVAECVLQRLAEPFRIGEEIAYISASIGITQYPDDAGEVEGLLKNADQAMYAAKNKGHNRFEYFTPAMQQAAQARSRLTNEMRGALAANQFRVYYQPIVELATGHIHKAEALIRWQHPEHGIVSPAQFIPLAEETGMIIEIGNWVFMETVRKLSRWRKSLNPALQISVNMSPIQFRQIGNVCLVCFDCLRELDLPGESMVIEITEGLLLDVDVEVTGKFLEFRDAGIQVSIDDFGTGYSSLSYLKKFNIDYLKIDQSFVRDMATDPDDMALSEAIIVMAHKLGLKVIAEGVETEEQRMLLLQAGCDYAQGYLFSRPVPEDEFEALLKREALKT